MDEKLKRYQGIFPAFYACYDDTGRVSTSRTKSLAKYLLAKGVTGLYVGGSSGECIYQSVEERKAILEAVMDAVGGKLVVSVQAYMGEPLRTPETMAQMSRACELGGAAAIRCQGLADIAAIKGRCEVPVIGLWKDGHEGVYITPTLRHARACVAAGADIVAIDATDRPRPDGKTVEDTFRPLHEEGVLLMADCATIEDIRRAVDMGFDLVSTTLSHGVAAIDCTMADGPDLPLLRQATEEFPGLPIICEGRVHTPEEARAAIDAGAWAVVVGTAITHPTSITSWFKAALEA